MAGRKVRRESWRN